MASSTSNSSTISPSSSSMMSSRVTSPAVPPYSSITIAMWNRCCCISRSRSATPLVSGTKWAGRASSLTGWSSWSSRSARIRSLACTMPTTSSMPCAAHGDAAVAVEDGHLHGVGHPEVGGDGDHVGARHHHLAHDGVAELDHRLDEPALLRLDHRVLDRQVGDGEQLLLRRVRPALEALAGEEDVGEPDQPARQQPERTPARQRLDRVGRPPARPGRCAGSPMSWGRPRRRRRRA